MKGILIDAKNREIKEIEYSDFDDLKKIMGIQWAQGLSVLPKKHTLYIDEEGLLNNPEHFFIIDGYPQPLAGNGAIPKCKFTVDEVGLMVRFLTLDQVQAGIRARVIDYSTYLTTSAGTEKIATIDLGAFDK